MILIQLAYPQKSKTIYAISHSPDGKVFNSVGQTWVDFNSSDWWLYAIAMTDVDGTGRYVGSYSVTSIYFLPTEVFYEQVGDNPDPAKDVIVGTGQSQGSANFDPSNLKPIEVAYGIRGASLYCFSFDEDGQVLNTGSLTYEVFNISNLSAYAINLTEQGTSGYQSAAYPAGVVLSQLPTEILYEMAGASPSNDDNMIGSGQSQGAKLLGIIVPGPIRADAVMELMDASDYHPSSDTEYSFIPSCQQNDIGLPIVVKFIGSDGNILDITDATSIKILLEYPSGTVVSFDATLYTNGADGKIVYATKTGELPEAGIHKAQGIVTVESNVYASPLYRFQVYKTLMVTVVQTPVEPPVEPPGENEAIKAGPEDAVNTVFNPDGTITETFISSNVTDDIAFQSDGKIKEEFSAPTSKTKTTTFNEDGSIMKVVQ